jgi:hypothetical protein
MIRTTPRRAPRTVATLALSAGLAVAGLGLAVPSSQAATDSWSCGLQGNQYCAAARHSLRAVGNYNGSGLTVGAAAGTTSNANSLYGSWSWGGGYTCHSYSGANVLYPLIRNGSGTTSTFYGNSSWGTGAQSC